MTFEARKQSRRRAQSRGQRAAAERRAQHGPLADLPGFAESLRLLVERERYSLTDISLMFGVSRERIRQLAALAGLDTRMVAYPKGMFAVRVWNDTAHQFEPVSKALLVAQKARQRRAIRARVRSGYLTHLIDVTRVVADRHPERRVALADVGEMLMGERSATNTALPQQVARLLLRAPSGVEAWAQVLAAADAQPAERGGRAHRNGYGDAARLRPALARELVAEGVPAPLIGWALGLNGVAYDSRIRRLLNRAP